MPHPQYNLDFKGKPEWISRCGLLAVLLGCCLLRGTSPWVVNHDCGWYLYAADRLLAGDALYLDIVEVNPPLIVYLSSLPAMLARILPIGLVPAFDVCVLLWIGLSLVGLSRVLRTIPAAAPRRRELLAGIAVVLTVVSGSNFGQREHLMLIAILPWLAIASGRLYGASFGGRLAFAVGCLAGVGVALKPWFVLAPLIVRFGTIGNPRSLFAQRRPEDLGLVLVLVIYALHFVFAPSTTEFIRVLGRLSQTYHGMNVDLTEVLTRPWALDLAVSIGIGSVLALVLAPLRRALVVLLLAGAAFGIGAVSQHKGWSYHFLPGLSTAWLGLVLVLCCGLVRGPSTHPVLRSLWFVALASFTAVAVGEHWLRRDPRGLLTWESEFTGIPGDMEEIEAMGDGGCVMVLDTDMPPFFAWLGDHRIRSASRYAHLWTLPVAMGDESEWRQLVAEIADDIRRHRPAWIYVRRGRPVFCPEAGATFSTRFEQASELAPALAAYRRVRNSGRFDLWRRVD